MRIQLKKKTIASGLREDPTTFLETLRNIPEGWGGGRQSVPRDLDSLEERSPASLLALLSGEYTFLLGLLSQGGRQETTRGFEARRHRCNSTHQLCDLEPVS